MEGQHALAIVQQLAKGHMMEQYKSTPAFGFEERGSEDQIAKLYGALALARASFGRIERSETVTVKMNNGGSYKFAYAPMEALLSATTQPLTNNGLVVLLPYSRPDNSKCVQWAILAHKDGGRLAFSFAFDPKSEIKDFGGQLTYYQRYAYRSALSLAADEDMDAMPEQSRGEVSAERSAPKQEARSQQSNAQPAQQTNSRARTPSSPPTQNDDGTVHATRVKEMQDGLRSLGFRSRAEAADFIFNSLGVGPEQKFALGDPLGSSLSVHQLDKVLTAVVDKRASK